MKMKDFRFKVTGNTPLLQLSNKLWAKLETFSLTGSIKDRIISFMLNRACDRGDINQASVLIEATSGNTGIALSAFGASMGVPVKIIMPKNMSPERKSMMRLYGAEIIDAPDSDFAEAIRMRDELLEKNSNYWSPRQFENLENILCHRITTAHEISSQLPSGIEWEAFVSGAGTGGTLMGVSEYICALPRLSTKMVMVMPEEDATSHGIQGINDGADFLVDHDKIDFYIKVKTEDAIAKAKELACTHGLLVGISAGANVLAAEKWIQEHKPSGAVVTMLCDRGERYLSTFGST